MLKTSCVGCRNGQNWASQQLWLQADNHCNWAGVACCTEGHMVPDPLWNADPAGWTTMGDHYCCCGTAGAVVALFLPGNNITGDIGILLAASALATSLLFINLEGNQLSGSIPQGIGRFSQLKGLHLASNKLQGPVHESMRDVSDTLISLDLSNNRISGTIPASVIHPSSSLEVLHLDNNLMHGDVPLSALVSMPQRVVFTATRNNLSGSLVLPELDHFNGTTHVHHDSQLEVLDLSGNKITGATAFQPKQAVIAP
jgi:Leucine-rich repeat (LRR) protein